MFLHKMNFRKGLSSALLSLMILLTGCATNSSYCIPAPELMAHGEALPQYSRNLNDKETKQAWLNDDRLYMRLLHKDDALIAHIQKYCQGPVKSQDSDKSWYDSVF